MKRSREDGGNPASLPASKRSTIGESSEQPRLTTEDALQYLKAVKEKFKDDYGKYGEFLEVMKDFKAQRVDTAGVIDRVKNLFKGHNKLILGFNTFLPKGYQIVLPEEKKQPVEFDQAINFVNKIKNRFHDNEQVYKAFLEILNNYRKGTKTINDVYEEVATLFHEHSDLLDEFTKFLPDTSANVPVKASLTSQKAPKKEKNDHNEHRAEKRKAEKEKKDDKDYEFDLDIGQRLPNKRKSARRADELIRKQSQTGEGASFAFFDKVKARLRNNKDSYKELLKVVNLYNEQIINRTDLQTLASDILVKYPDLLEGFSDLLQSENADFGAVLASRKLDPDSKKERERDKDDKDDGKESKDKVSLLPLKDKNLNKPVSELDLSNCESCTPSYRLLPKNYPRLISSYRNELANSVLNDSWVSVTSGSEDYGGFKHMRRNQYEESLFRCEDDRFELDMLIETTMSTSKHVQELLEKMQETGTQVRSIDEHLSGAHLRCIERLYGDHGLDTLELLRKNPGAALPVVLCRLKQKEEEWINDRTEMNKVWAEVYSKNYHKSLDHRSFYFKQQDKKNLSKKGLLAEITEIHEKTRKEEEYIISTVMGNKRPFIPDMKFNCSDLSIHEELFRVMKHSADQICDNMAKSEKIMRVWTTFLESLFGFNSVRPPGTEDREEAVKLQPKSRASSIDSAASGHLSNADRHDDAGSKDGVDEMEVDDAEEGRKPSTASKAGHEGGGKRKSPEAEQVATGKKETGACSTKAEREEGELSPSPEGTDALTTGRSEDAKKDTYEGEHDADADDEGDDGAAMSSDDEGSGNPSEAAEEGSDVGEDHDEEAAGKADSDGEGEGMADADDTEADGLLSLSADRSSVSCKPLAAHARSSDNTQKASTVFYGNDNFYILFKLYQTLYERVQTAKVHAEAAELKWKGGSPVPNLYEKFLAVLYNFLDGSADGPKYEDECRSLFGTHSYVLFTLDLLIFKLVKQLQKLAADETAIKLLVLHSYEKSRGAAGFSDLVYHANACLFLHDENIYRFEHRPSSSDFVVQLMDGASEKFEVPPSAMDASFSNYLVQFLLSEGPEGGLQRDQKIFLERNKRRGDLESAMKNAQIVNGLEYKISCKTSKVSYVLDTEDCFHRPRRHRSKESNCLKCVCLGAGVQSGSCEHVCFACSKIKCCVHACEACVQARRGSGGGGGGGGGGNGGGNLKACECHKGAMERVRRFREFIDKRLDK